MVVSKKGFANAFHGGTIQGTSSFLVRRSDGFSWAILFNCDKATDNETYLDRLVDGPMHVAVNAVAKNSGLKRKSK